MSILIFLAVIVVLIVVHELGHFVVAKLFGIRVDEFGLGYPPRAMVITKIGETLYTLNWLPFGGFVKIYGEDPAPHGVQVNDARAFSSKPRFAQALVLVAGVAMNLLLAYVLIAGALVIGTPRPISQDEIAQAHNVELAVSNVLSGSPASLAKLAPGDSILEARSVKGVWSTVNTADQKSFSAFIADSGSNEVRLTIRRDGEERTIVATPAAGVVPSDLSRHALGVEVITIGTIPLSFTAALIEGAYFTWGATKMTAVGLWHLFAGIFTLSADLSQVSGPVGIVSIVGSASAQGIGNLLSIMAMISINLAIINLIPIPALDGGRLLFVIIESIIRRPIKATVANALNTTGFTLLIILMLFVTVKDIFKIIG